MISRRTAKQIAELYAGKFSGTRGDSNISYVYQDNLYDFLYEFDHEAWFCNAAKSVHYGRNLKEWLMKLHTGETVVPVTKDWSWPQRQKLGQRYLRELAEDYISFAANRTDQWSRQHYGGQAAALKKSMELDGFVFRDGTFYEAESNVLNVEEETGVLHRMYADLALANRETAFHQLNLSETHYLSGHWADCIANARKFLESVLQESAAKFSQTVLRSSLSESTYGKPVLVREFLEKNELLEKKETEALSKIYGLLSHTGSHPYMAENDQARLLRQLALTLSQFVMLRLEGRLKSLGAAAA
jgi:hypothetical protein